MQILKYLLSISFIITSIQGFSQNVGDTLFAARKNGVTVYKNPNFSSSPIGEVNLNSEIEILEKLQLDTSLLRIGNWYKIKSKSVKKGYVFGGFLNRERIPTNLTSLEVAFQSIVSPYPILYSTSYGKTQQEINIDDIGVHISGSRSHSRTDIDFWEGDASEIFLFDIELNEIINIIESIELDGKSTDFEQLLAASNPDDLTKFRWESGIDDWITDVTIEKGPASGIRIMMVAGE